MMTAVGWWRWRRALWGGLRDELLDCLSARHKKRGMMNSYLKWWICRNDWWILYIHAGD